jgi:nucleotide-binding universal stress UspA family protein
MAIIVGVDGSEQSRQVLEWAIEEARLRGDRIAAIMAFGVPPTYYPHGVPGAGSAELIERIKRGTQERLAAILEEVRPLADGVDIDGEVVESQQPARILTERAGNDDLLVVGSRGLGGFKGLLLGSVSQQCVQHAHCAVVVVHPKG